MVNGWEASLIIFFQTLSEILTAGIAITAFSLLLYSLAFNLRDRIARSFAFMMICLVIVSTAKAIASTQTSLPTITFWLKFQWLGIIFLPAAYLHFSDAILAMTGRPSRGRRRWAVRLSYVGGALFLLALPFSILLKPAGNGASPSPQLQPTPFTDIFILAYLLAVGSSWINFVRAYRRTTTTTSRRRMFYLIIGSLAPALSSFPFLPYIPNFSAQHPLLFWSGSVLLNIWVGIFLVVMAYVVAFFGVSWPDRVVKVRLFKWIMRGPFTASLTLGLVTIVRRSGEAFGTSYTALVPIAMVASILLCEYLITLFSSVGQRWLFARSDRPEIEKIQALGNQLLTENDLRQFLETILSAVCDRLQASGAYVIALNVDGLELLVTTGKSSFNKLGPDGKSINPDQVKTELLQRVTTEGFQASFFRWGQDDLFPLMNGTAEKPDLLGLLGVSSASSMTLDEEQSQAMDVLVGRASMALRDWRVQQKVFHSLEDLSSQVDLI